MGLLQAIFGKMKIGATAAGFWTTLDGYTPSFTSWGGELYESEIVRAAINATATHVSKLHVTVQGPANPKLQTRLKQGPNEWQTWGQFLYRLATILEMQNTAFIVPVLNEFGETVGIFPVLPSNCDIVAYRGAPWLRYTFSSGQTAAIEMARCGIMTKFQYKSDVFGEDNRALTPTMELANLQNQGIAEAVKNGASYRFIAQLNNFANDADLTKEAKRFSRENLQGEGGGVLLFPNTYQNVRQLENKPYVLGTEEMQRIRTGVFDYFGTNEDVLQNRAYGDKWNAFYEGKIEWFSVQFSDVATRMLFTERERAGGTMLMATANRLQYMSNTEKLNVSAQMADRGIMNRDEIREIWNLPPLPDGQGQAYTIRGEYYLLGSDGSVTKKGDDLTDGK